MVKKALILGGTSFFGKRLAGMLKNVTVASRHSVNPVERRNPEHLKNLAAQGWDIVFDQLCFNGKDARIAAEAFRDCHYIMASSIAVYGPVCKDAGETLFNASAHAPTGAEDYAGGKRDAEAILARSFKFTAVRLPPVFGPDDPTGRLDTFLKEVATGSVNARPNKMSVISSEGAAKFLKWVGENSIEGAYNACSNAPITTDQLISFAASRYNISVDTRDSGESIFNRAGEWTMSTLKAQQKGYSFDRSTDWIYDLIDRAA